jgi:hypothetical protein
LQEYVKLVDTETVRTLALTFGKPANPPMEIRVKRENQFGVTFENGFRATLEFAPSEMAGQLDARMRWIEALADTGFACPWPQRTISGEFLASAPHAMVAFMMQDTEGRPVNLKLNPVEQLAVYEELGTLLADFHLSADTVSLAELPGTNSGIIHANNVQKTEDVPTGENRPELTSAIEILSERRPHPDCAINEFSISKVVRQDGMYILNDFNTLRIGKRHVDLACLLIDGKGPAELSDRFDAVCSGYEIGGISLNHDDRLTILSHAIVLKSKKPHEQNGFRGIEESQENKLLELFRRYCM